MPTSAASGLNAHGKSRLFIVTEYADSTQNSTGYYWSKIIFGLAENFDGISVISPEPPSKDFRSVANGLTHIPVNNPHFNKRNLFTRLFGQIIQSMLFTIAILRTVRRGDTIFSGTNPALLLLLLSILKPALGFRWIVLVHDVFPENLATANVITKASLLYKLSKCVFDRVYSSADTLIAIGRDMRHLLSEKTRQLSRIEYTPNWVDPKDILPLSRDSISVVCNRAWNKKVVFQFFGNLGRLQGLKNILQAIQLVTNERAAFLFIGAGSEEHLISAYIKDHPEDDILHLPQIAFTENNVALSLCDVALVSLAKGMNGLAVPSKAYFSLAADKPLLVVTEEGSELFQLLSEDPSVGWLCEAGNPSKLAGLIDNICDLDLQALKGVPRSVLINKYNYKNSIDQYSKYIHDVMEK